MNCPKCNEKLAENSTCCSKCGEQINYQNQFSKTDTDKNTNTSTAEQKNLSTNVFGIVSLVVSILAIVTSVIPIVNNVSVFVAIIGIVLWIPAFISIRKQKTKGKVIATVALILSIVAIVLTLVCQAACGAILDEATGGATSTVKASSTTQKTEFAVGETLELSNGLKVSVDSVTPGFTDYSGSPLTKVVVTYNNDGKDKRSFNSYDWKAEDPQGAQTSSTIYSKADTSLQLNSGELAPGGKKTGEIYFKGTVAKMVYSTSILSDKSFTWIV